MPSRSDVRWRWMLFAGHVATVAGQQIVPNPALVPGGSITQEGPRPTISRGVTEILGALVVYSLTGLYAGIAGTTAQRRGIGRKIHPTMVFLRVTQAAGDHRGRSHPRILFMIMLWWPRSLSRVCRRGNGEHGGGCGEYRTAHACGDPRHQENPSLPRSSRGNLSVPARPSPEIRYVAMTTLGSSAFFPLSARLPPSPTVAPRAPLVRRWVTRRK